MGRKSLEYRFNINILECKLFLRGAYVTLQLVLI